jgi:hypothetical protein
MKLSSALLLLFLFVKLFVQAQPTVTTHVTTDMNFCDGYATLSSSPPATTWSWTDANGQVLQQNQLSIYSLCAGDYFLSYVDQSSAENISIPFSIAYDPCGNVNVTLTTTPSYSSLGTCNGTAQFISNGGQTPCTFQWQINGANIGMSSSLSNLCPGDQLELFYSCGNCFNILQATIIDEPNNPCDVVPINANFSVLNTELDSCKGAITCIASGGFPPFSYNWNNAETSNFIDSLCSDTYAVTITDNLGCTHTATTFVGNGTENFNVYVLPMDIIPNGACSGSASAIVSGGQAPYTYSYSNGQSVPSISGLCPGNYSVTVTDANNLISTASFHIYSQSQVYQSTNYQDSTVIDSLFNNLIEDCSIDYSLMDTVFIASCTFTSADVVTIHWIGGGGCVGYSLYTTYQIFNYTDGVYEFTLQLNCPNKSEGQAFKAVDRFYLNRSAGLEKIDLISPVLINPNPVHDQFSIQFDTDEKAFVQVIDVMGRVVYENKQYSSNSSISMHNFSSGQYIVNVTLAKKKSSIHLEKQ